MSKRTKTIYFIWIYVIDILKSLKLPGAFKGFVIHHKKDHEVWQKIDAGPTNRTQTVTGLLCGTTYRFYINARNSLGYSPDSDVIAVKTNGSSKCGQFSPNLLSRLKTKGSSKPGKFSTNIQ